MKLRNRVVSSLLALAVTMGVSTTFLTGCGNEQKGVARSASTPVPIVTSLDKASMTADGLAQYYMYCILRGEYDKAWALTYKPDTLVFSDKLLKLKFEEFGVTPVEETIMPLGYGLGINKIYNEDGQLTNNKGQLIDEEGNLINEEGQFIDEEGNVIEPTEPTTEATTEATAEVTTEETTEPATEEVAWGSHGEAIVYAEDDHYVKYGDFLYRRECEEVLPSIMTSENKWVQPYRTGLFMYGATVDVVDETKDIPMSTVTVHYGYDNAGFNTLSWTFQVRGSAETGFEIINPAEFLHTEVLRLKVPDGVDVKVNGAYVSPTLCGVDDYYVLEQYPNYPAIDIELSCVTLGKLEKKLDIIDTGVVTPDTQEYWNLANKNGELNTYELRWDASKTDIEEAESWLPTGIQAVFDDVLAGTDLEDTDFRGNLWSEAEKDAYKTNYLKAIETFAPTKISKYSNLFVKECNIWRHENVQFEEVANEVINKEAINFHVELKYSYSKTQLDTGDLKATDNEIKFQVQLTKEDGEWKFYKVPEELLRKLS